ncbi:MAG: UDP-N-acetylmuramoyl-L-alanyl-D-glutamate--2,6-diaminopime late ligase [Candidatus Peribacteria bacterium]|nr:UDP-N-acetylmuramoyl-L-alanyl-D-glutamate--2,6-diaminopime late ligase [Candidatus Peribacteria bacterium]
MLNALKGLIGQRSPIRLEWHRAKALVAAARYGFPARKLKIIGVTGTDGKTTTIGMTAHILHEAGVQVGALSTAFFQVRNTIEWNATQKTLPSPFLIQKFLRRLVTEKCTHAVLEYSSHGLVQGRGIFTWPVVTAITNTSAEHLDYHGTMEQYRKDKRILFEMLGGKGTKVLNMDDETFALYLPVKSAKTIGYSVEGQRESRVKGLSKELFVTAIRASTAGTAATLHQIEEVVSDTMPITLAIPGEFNMENALAALSIAKACGLDMQKATTALASFPGVPGRMERIPGNKPYSVFVDFTVTPVSYQKTLSSLKALLAPNARLLVLTGSCGERMKEKRPFIGRVCSELADLVVVTNEDPYNEDPQAIIDEVWAGIDQAQTEAHKISDRLEAIKFLLSQAREHDVVIFCGKGSDTTMWTKDGQIPWNERQIVKDLLAAA